MKPRFVFASLVTLLCLALVALAACGASTTSSVSSATPTPSEGVTPTASGPATVQVTLTEFTIQSSLTTFQVGVPYHFVVTNAGQATHEFMAGPIAVAHASEDARDAAKLFEVSELEPGQTGTADYTFTKPYPAGTLEFSCHVPGHYEEGMRLDFSVSV